MVVQDIISLSRHSELSNTALKIDNPDNTAAIVSFINMGMIELYKRFVLKTEEAIISLVEGKTFYDLPENFMYVLASFEEAEELSVIKNKEIPINDENDPYSIFFPSHKQVQIPVVTDGGFISIIYAAKPTPITVNDLTQELDLPEVLIECLLHYIGYRGHLGIRGDGQSENNAHFARFERSVIKAKELNVTTATDSYSMSERLSSRGFI
mgnify:CR=1 FL=1